MGRQFGAVGLLASALTTTTPPVASSDCAMLMLKRSSPGVRLERIVIAPGSTRVFPVTAQGENIAPILPWGVGQSGDVSDLAQTRFLIGRCVGDTLHIAVRTPDGRLRDLPPVSADDVANTELRVSVQGPNGLRVVFRARGDQIEPDTVGPLLDAFGGQVSPTASSYVVTTEVTPTGRAPRSSGSAPLTFENGYFFTSARVGDGPARRLVLDLAASRTAVGRAMVPAGTVIQPLTGTEYSAAGARTVTGELGGAGGSVGGYLGRAILPRLRWGGITVTDLEVDVLDSLSAAGGQPIIGILGLDVLRRAPSATLTLGAAPAIALGAPTTAAGGTTVPFSFTSGHLFVRGRIGGLAVPLILDSGAPTSYLTWAAAADPAVRVDSTPGPTVYGLDNRPLATRPGVVSELRLGGLRAADVPVNVADLPVFQRMSLTEPAAGLLGNDFLRRFERVEVDWGRQTLRIW